MHNTTKPPTHYTFICIYVLLLLRVRLFLTFPMAERRAVLMLDCIDDNLLQNPFWQMVK